MLYENKYCTTILQEVANLPIEIVFLKWNNIDILPNIYSQPQFSHLIKDGMKSYEPIEYQNKKIISSKNLQWKWDLYPLL